MKKLLFVSVPVLFMNICLIAQDKIEKFVYKNGDFTIHLLSDNQGSGNKDILIGVTPLMLEKFTDNGHFPNAMNAFYLKTPDGNILFDSGIGKNLFQNLNDAGIAPENIDMVFITHMHGDHIGGMMRDGKIAFPHAKVFVPQPEYNYWMSDIEMNKLPENKRKGFVEARKFLEAYKDQITLFEPGNLTAGTVLAKGIKAIAAYGHTPGHTMYEVESKGEKLLIWGDLTHALAIQMPFPQISVTYDIDPALAASIRLKVLNFVSENKVSVAGMHIPYPSMGKIERNEHDGAYKFIPFHKTNN